MDYFCFSVYINADEFKDKGIDITVAQYIAKKIQEIHPSAIVGGVEFVEMVVGGRTDWALKEDKKEG